MSVSAVVFDLFGTLLDIASLRDAAGKFTDDPVPFVATWREKQLAYAFASAIMDTYADFDTMTLYGARYAARKYGVTLGEDGERELVRAWEAVQPYADAIPALTALHAAGIPCAVLTNGAPGTSAKAMANAGIADMIEATLSVDSIGVFKPDRRVYELVTTHYATGADRLIFVTSNGWDATGAAECGMRVAWCNRLAAPPETFGKPPEWTIADLHALPEIVAGIAP